MAKPDRKKVPPIIIASPLIVYEIAFALFVIYYIQQGALWYNISSLSVAVAAITALVIVLIDFRRWSSSAGTNKKHFRFLLFNLLFFALYLFCLLVLLNQVNARVSPPLFLIPLLAVPPFISFAAFLYDDSRHSAPPGEEK
jgi:1,4-dihydroxy-2-naphthoate octaprenyltransferase